MPEGVRHSPVESAAGYTGTIGVVIPGYGHPQFLAEAIISACTQEIDQPVQVVVVDDGCRFEETGQVVSNLMERFPGKLYYLRQANTRLPGARNAGVRFLMSMVPDLDAIFFLDADNRLSPYSLRNYRAALGHDPAVGWAYPDIAFFGLSWGAEGFDIRETAPVYSKLKHLTGNISEAGSLVRADLFRNGVFFDEAMRFGFEDWDFWLSALEAGYTGVRVPYAGFLYRRRPESMLADSRRQEDGLIAGMQQKHAPLFRPRALMALEQEEAPHYAIILVDADTVILTSDPTCERTRMTMAEFRDLTDRWQSEQREIFFPDNLLVMSAEQWQQMTAQPHFLRWVFWSVKESPAALQRWLFESRPRPYTEGLSQDTPLTGNTVLGLTAEGFLKVIQGASLDEERLLGEFAPYTFQTPTAMVVGHTKKTVKALMSWLNGARRAKPAMRAVHANRCFAGPSAVNCRRMLIDPICAEEKRRPFPAASGRQRLLVAVDQGHLLDEGSRRAFTSLLSRLHSATDEVVLVVEQGAKVDMADLMPDEWLPYVADLVMLDRVDSGQEYRMYLGRRIYSLFTLRSKEAGVTIARTADLIVTIGVTAFLEVLGDARQFGVKGHVYFDGVFGDPDPVMSDASTKILAFEHAEESIVCDSRVVAHALSAQGFPPAKVVSVSGFLAQLGCKDA